MNPITIKNAINKLECGTKEVNNTQSTETGKEIANIANIATAQTPFIPNDIYESLPDLLKRSCKYADAGRSKDVMLLSTLTTLSACSRGIHGVYDRKKTHPNLYTFIIAPAASGKGIMNEAKSLGYKLHDEIAQNKDVNFVESNAKRPLLFIPASSSKVAIINHLKDSKDCGIICETEADTLYGALKQQWGDFSDLLRKAFHNEEISHSSNTDGYSSIKQPRLSVLLTSTPSQVKGIIESPENGLFSRFIYYNYTARAEYRDVFAEDDFDYSSYYNGLSNEVYEFAKFSIQNPCKFSLTYSQKHLFNFRFKKKLQDCQKLGNAGDESTVLRAGGICFRIAMLLTELSRFEAKDTSDTIECSDANFTTALGIAGVLYDHSIKTLNDLSGGIVVDKLDEFLKSLPEKFKKADIVSSYEGKVKERTVYNWMGKLHKKGKIKASNNAAGEFCKTNLQ